MICCTGAPLRRTRTVTAPAVSGSVAQPDTTTRPLAPYIASNQPCAARSGSGGSGSSKQIGGGSGWSQNGDACARPGATSTDATAATPVSSTAAARPALEKKECVDNSTPLVVVAVSSVPSATKHSVNSDWQYRADPPPGPGPATDGGGARAALDLDGRPRPRLGAAVGLEELEDVERLVQRTEFG